jgi:hypothetical protein
MVIGDANENKLPLLSYLLLPMTNKLELKDPEIAIADTITSLHKQPHAKTLVHKQSSQATTIGMANGRQESEKIAGDAVQNNFQ